MSSLGTIWTYPSNPRAMKTNKTPEFLADFPLARVPTFKSAGGLTLYESDAIALYAAESGGACEQLLGTSVDERAVVRQWIGFADHELFGPLTTLILWRYGMGHFDENAEKIALQHLVSSLDVVERQLQGTQYIASEKLSLADLSMAAAMYWGFGQVVDRKLRGRYTRTTEWYLRVIQDKRINSAFGEGDFIEIRKERP
ncbi:hypothetical protein TruAng_004893 [Truncatella angustata]|nr:hypothetical protein TruAng_004893 [Truncatella angustata]